MIDGIIPEVRGGAHRDVIQQANYMKEHLQQTLSDLTVLTPAQLVQDRYDKFKNIGQYA